MEIHNFLEVFFNHEDAEVYRDGHMDDHPESEWDIVDDSIIRMPSGGYRVGLIFTKKQMELPF